MSNIDLITVWRTPNMVCPACRERQLHTAEERRIHHPFSGHGFNGTAWTHRAIDPETPANRQLALQQAGLRAASAAAAAYSAHAQVTQRGNK
jgi:hypothetical protein